MGKKYKMKLNLTNGETKETEFEIPELVSKTMTGATADTDGASGLVPAPKAGQNEKFLRGDGTWAEVDKTLSKGGDNPLKTVNIGELFEQPENYLAWFQGCMKYDYSIGCPVAVISGKDAHATGAGKCYFFKIEPKTGEVSLSVAGQYDDDDTYGCFSQSFYIDNDGNYHFYASIHESSGWDEVSKRKYTSTDKGTTWTYEDVTGTTTPAGSIIKLKSGRLLGLASYGGDTRNQAIYSDDNGETWIKGTVFVGSIEIEIIELKDILIAIGRKALTYTEPLPAVFYFSHDSGESWTDGVESATITDMCNPCSGIYWEKNELMELFYCSRASSNGNTGTIYHAYAMLDDALNDNFTVEAIGESKQSAVGIDFGYCATVCDQNEKAWVIYYDAADSGSGVNLNLILADKTCVTLPVSDNTSSLIALYSSAKIQKLLTKQYNALIVKINEAIMSGEIIQPGEDENGKPSSYIFDGIIANFNFLDSSKIDEDAKTVTDTINGIAATCISETFPEARENSLARAFYTIPSVSDYYGSTAVDKGFTVEVGIYRYDGDNWSAYEFWHSGAAASGKYKLTGDSSQASIYTYIDTSSTSKRINLWWGSKAVPIPSGTVGFVHIVATYDASGTLTIYKNGEVLNTITPVDFSAWDATLVTATTGLKEAMKSYRIYSRALTAEEVASNYKYELATIV